MVPLAMQSLPPVLIFVSMIFCPESPRWLAAHDDWDQAAKTLADVRHLPVEHPYIQQELLELSTQLEQERSSVHGEGFWALQKECWLVPGNRKRALISIGLMVCQQWTGVSAAIVSDSLSRSWCSQVNRYPFFIFIFTDERD